MQLTVVFSQPGGAKHKRTTSAIKENWCALQSELRLSFKKSHRDPLGQKTLKPHMAASRPVWPNEEIQTKNQMGFTLTQVFGIKLEPPHHPWTKSLDHNICGAYHSKAIFATGRRLQVVRESALVAIERTELTNKSARRITAARSFSRHDISTQVCQKQIGVRAQVQLADSPRSEKQFHLEDAWRGVAPPPSRAGHEDIEVSAAVTGKKTVTTS